jgi:hypothetical protein
MIVFTAGELNGCLGFYLINSRYNLMIFLHMDDRQADYFD